MDALKTDSKVGITIICGGEMFTYKTMPQYSIYTAEAFAIIKALSMMFYKTNKYL